MAFPTIPTTASGDLLSATTSPASTTHTFPSLSSLRGGAGPQAGDLLIAICVQYEGGTLNAEFSAWGASFTETIDDALGSGTGNEALGVAHKVATGSESGTFTVTSAHSFKSVNFLMRIPAGTWHGTTIPEVQAATRAAGAVADPGSFDPTNWAAEDTLWIAVAGQSETSTTGSPPTLNSPPTNYAGELIVARVADAVGDITAGVAFRQLNASSEDVGTWAASNANRGNGIAAVIAVRPVGSIPHTVDQPDTLALSDSAATAKTIPKSVSDPLTPSDSFSRVHEATRTPTEAVALADQADAAKTIPKSIDDSAELADAGTIAWGIDESGDDTVALADSLTRVHEMSRTVADPLALVDGLTRVTETARTFADSLTLADALAKSRANVLADSIALADEATPDLQVGGQEHTVTPDDSLALADQLDRALGLGLADTLALADEFIRAVDAARALADTLTLADEATPDHVVPGAPEVNQDDTLALSDSFSRAVELARSLADSLNLADAAQTAAETQRALDDAVALSDEIARTFGLAFADSLVLADEATPDLTTGPVDYTRQIDDTVSPVDSFSRVSEYQRMPTETLAFADLFARAVTYERTVADLLALGDLAAPEIPGEALIDDEITLEDELLHVLVRGAIRTGHLGGEANGHIEQPREGVIAR